MIRDTVTTSKLIVRRKKRNFINKPRIGYPSKLFSLFIYTFHVTMFIAHRLLTVVTHLFLFTFWIWAYILSNYCYTIIWMCWLRNSFIKNVLSLCSKSNPIWIAFQCGPESDSRMHFEWIVSLYYIYQYFNLDQYSSTYAATPLTWKSFMKNAKGQLLVRLLLMWVFTNWWRKSTPRLVQL